MTTFTPDRSKDVLLQQPAFVFIDRIVSYDEDKTVVQYTVPADGLMMDGNVLSAAGVMEHMAQSMAARVGYISKYILHIPIQIGMLGQVRDFSLSRHPQTGDILTTEVRLLHEMMGISLARIEVSCRGERIAEAQIKTVIKDEG